uniref:Uncharacterized protein n=1 Tax=Schistosoma curassoni TaxID=6186 RepID=A0A183JCZ3_9TREM
MRKDIQEIKQTYIIHKANVIVRIIVSNSGTRNTSVMNVVTIVIIIVYNSIAASSSNKLIISNCLMRIKFGVIISQ